MENNFLKRIFIYLLNAILTAAIGIMSMKIFSMYVDPDEFGIYSVVSGIYSLISGIFSLFFSQSILRYYSEYKSDENRLYAGIYQLFTIFAIAYFLVCAVYIPLVTIFITNYTYKILIIIFSGVLLFECFHSIAVSFARCKGMAIKETIGNIINQLTKLAVFCLYFFIISHTVESIVVGTLCGFIVCIFMLRKALVIKNIPKKPLEKEVIFKIIKYSLPLIGVPIVNYLLSMSDQLIINAFFGEYDVGLYSMGHRIAASIFTLITTFLITSGHPIAMKKYDQESKEAAASFVSDLSFLYFLICLPCVVEIFAFSSFIIQIFASEKYLDSAFVLSISSIGLVFAGYINYTNKPWEMTQRSYLIMVFSAVGGVLNIALNFIFVPIYGYNAAAVTTIASYLTVVALSRLASAKIMNISVGIIDTIKILLSCFALFAFLNFANRFFVSNIWTFVIFAFLGLLIYIILIFAFAKKRIIRVFKEFKTIK